MESLSDCARILLQINESETFCEYYSLDLLVRYSDSSSAKLPALLKSISDELSAPGALDNLSWREKRFVEILRSSK